MTKSLKLRILPEFKSTIETLQTDCFVGCMEICMDRMDGKEHRLWGQDGEYETS